MTRRLNPEIFELENPIKVFSITAESFPGGVMKAHETLHGIASLDPKRQYFGISWGGPSITYKAAATEVSEGELKDKGLEEFTIRAGKYLSVKLDDLGQIKDVFPELIQDSRVDPRGYCVEMYLDDNDVRCMVTTK